MVPTRRFWIMVAIGIPIAALAAAIGAPVIAIAYNLLLAAIMGVVIPLVMSKFGRDPAVGSSVLITAMTDSGGFFIFLGLATLFLL